MNRGAFVDTYRQNAVQTASPLQLVIMLYDGAIRFCEMAKTAMADGDLFNQNHYIQKAQRIVLELTSCLDINQGGEIGKNLFSLYTFCYDGLVAANLADKPEDLDAVIAVLKDLREGWTEIEQMHRTQRPTEELRLAS